MGLRVGRFAAVTLPLAIAACGPRADADKNLDSLDGQLVDENGTAGNAADPALLSALQDQIMVDPALTQQANNDAIRPPAQPYSGAVPPDGIAAAPGAAGSIAGAQGADTSQAVKSAPAPQGDCPQCKVAKASYTLGALASKQSDGRTSGCAGGLNYSTGWATRLPADLPLYPDARVAEAAGSQSGHCALRAVSFSTSAPLGTVVDFYYTRATNAGYSAEHQSDGSEHVLGGTRGKDGGAYAIFLTSRGDGGTDVDLIANNGS